MGLYCIFLSAYISSNETVMQLHMPYWTYIVATGEQEVELFRKLTYHHRWGTERKSGSITL